MMNTVRSRALCAQLALLALNAVAQAQTEAPVGMAQIRVGDAGSNAWITRPQEVSRLIDALAVNPAWSPLLQLDKVGVHGISAGGATALSLAGAQWRVLDLVQHCLACADPSPTTEGDAGFCFNGLADSEHGLRHCRPAFISASYSPGCSAGCSAEMTMGARRRPCLATGQPSISDQRA